MKLVRFNDGAPGLLTDHGVIDVSQVVGPEEIGDERGALAAIIRRLDDLRSDLLQIEKSGEVIPLTNVILKAPLPKPSKILCMGGNFTEFGHRPPGPMWGFLKASEAVIGPDGVVILPPDDANIFHHEAELVVVFGSDGKDVREQDALDYILGYTCGIDVSARMQAVPGTSPPEFQSWRGISPHKSFPTFAPVGPAIVTKDEILDPHNLHVQLSVNDELRGDFSTSDMAYSIAKSIAFVSSFEGFSAGDILYTGTNHQGLGAMQNGDKIRISIEQVGNFACTVQDPLQRRWERGIDQETAEDMRKGTGGPGRRQRPL